MSKDQTIAQLLRAAPAFSALPADICDKLAALTRERILAPGEYLAHEGDPGDELYLVVSGSLSLTRNLTESVEIESAPIALGSAGPGQILGELSVLTGHARSATMQAESRTVVRALGSAEFDQLCSKHPGEMAATVAWMADRLDAFQISASIDESHLLRALSPEAKRELALGCTRVDLKAGQTLYREGDPGNALYLILSGRIHLLRQPGAANFQNDAAENLLSELGKGDVLGELSLLTGETRSATAVAVRDTHLARLDKDSFDRLVSSYPVELLGLFTRQLAARLRERNLAQGRGRKAEGRPPLAIAVLPLTPSEQSASSGGARDFTTELVRQLSAFGPTLHLNRTVIDLVFRQNRWEQLAQMQTATHNIPVSSDLAKVTEMAERRLMAWLDDLETIYRHIVYEADYHTGSAESAWTSRCLRQADVLLLVAGGPADPQSSERTMIRLSQKALPSVKTTLVLLHAEGPGSITYTRVWKQSLGISSHEHIRRRDRNGGSIHAGDVARLARALNRQSVGLALGGGFALGLAHIGVVDAMRDLQIPIDFVGGTSMGAIIAAACAQEFTHDQMLEVMEKGCAQALKGDYTLPIVSLLTGRKVGMALGKYLEHLDIEDLWLPYFAISASLVQARMVVHRHGSALRSVLASCRAPGMFPPLSWDGDVLVDGGLVNNIPADVMRECVGSGIVFAADVSPESEFLGSGVSEDASTADFGTHLSGWKVARHNLNPFRGRPRRTTLADILVRLIRLGGVAHKQQIRASADLYLSVPLQKFSIRDFHRGEEMSRIGYDHAVLELEAWIAKHGRPWRGANS